MSKPITVTVAGCGPRGHFAYAPYAHEHPDELRIIGAADLIPERLQSMAEDYDIPKENLYNTAEEMFKRDKFADIAFICTQDRDHVGHALLAIEKGYDLLLEKPISPDMSECKRLLKAAQERHSNVTVCHVLRYTPFYQTVKRIIESGEIGEVVNINAAENVAYWHQCHSFVRGNWRSSTVTSPMILAKSCHDMDILLWLMNKSCKAVSSFGGLHEFKASKAPKGAAQRCLDGCECKDGCPYDAEKIYLTGTDTGFDYKPDNWMLPVLCNAVPSREGIEKAIKEGQYGKCVYHCDNDVVDHQQVNMLMEDDTTISFSMSAFSKECYRTIQIMGTKGEINGDIERETIKISRYGKPVEIVDLNVKETISGHGGGDGMLIKNIIDLAQNGGGSSLTSLDKSLASHYLALAAEKSRVNGGEVVQLKEYIESIK